VRLSPSRLELVILVPVIVFLIVVSAASYSLIGKSVEDFANRTIRQHFGYMAEGIYSIADRELEQLQRVGRTSDAKATKIRQVSALIKIEDFGRKNQVGVVIFFGDEPAPVLTAGLPDSLVTISRESAESANERATLSDGHDYLVHSFDFTSWQWRIVLLQDAGTYSSLLRKATLLYALSVIAFVVIAVVLILYLRRTIASPIQQIVQRFQMGKMPDYKGIQELQYLSESIGQMMQEVSSHREQLEAEVRTRTGELTRTVEELEALREVGHAVSSSLDVAQVLKTIVTRACELSEAQGGIIYEFEQSEQQFHAVATHGLTTKHVTGVTSMPIRVGEGAVGAAAKSLESVQVSDLSDERTFVAPRVRRVLIESGAHSLIAVPLEREAGVLGCLLIWRNLRADFSDETVHLLQAFASQSVLAIHNARQASNLADLNEGLERKVSEKIWELNRVSQLKRFFSPQLAELIVSSGEEKFMESHRQEIAVVFCDLRNFTTFSAVAEPEEQFRVLREYHSTVGSLIFRYGATLEHFAGDGVMAFFNDPVPCEEPARRAIEMALAMRDDVEKLSDQWRKRGLDLGFGVGIELGYATLGQVGFEGQFHYMAIGSVANLAARLCDRAEAGQVLITQRVYSEAEDIVRVESVGQLEFKGFPQPISVFNVRSLDGDSRSEKTA